MANFFISMPFSSHEWQATQPLSEPANLEHLLRIYQQIPEPYEDVSETNFKNLYQKSLLVATN